MGSSTGALVVVGNVGVGNNIQIGGSVKIDSTAEAMGSSTGALVVVGNVGVGKNIEIDGILKINSPDEVNYYVARSLPMVISRAISLISTANNIINTTTGTAYIFTNPESNSITFNQNCTIQMVLVGGGYDGSEGGNNISGAGGSGGGWIKTTDISVSSGTSFSMTIGNRNQNSSLNSSVYYDFSSLGTQLGCTFPSNQIIADVGGAGGSPVGNDTKGQNALSNKSSSYTLPGSSTTYLFGGGGGSGGGGVDRNDGFIYMTGGNGNGCGGKGGHGDVYEDVGAENGNDATGYGGGGGGGGGLYYDNGIHSLGSKSSGSQGICIIFVKEIADTTTPTTPTTTSTTTPTTTSTTTTAALFVKGGTYINANTVSTSSTTGALVVKGGVGVSGKIFCGDETTSVSFNATSDYRIKTNVENLPNQYNIDILRPVKYYNIQSKNEDIGLIAHEVQEYYPFLVRGVKDDPDGFQSINYNGIIGVLIKEIQDLKKRLKIQEEKIQVLENR